jgi:hypothetical protein
MVNFALAALGQLIPGNSSMLAIHVHWISIVRFSQLFSFALGQLGSHDRARPRRDHESMINEK